MNTAFFKSEYLNKTIYLHEISQLGEQDLSLLKAELEISIESMNLNMHQKRDTAPSDWLYGISLKIKVCEQFLNIVKESMYGLFHHFYHAVCRTYGKDGAVNCLKIAREQAQKQTQPA